MHTEGQQPAAEPQPASDDVNWFELEGGLDLDEGMTDTLPAADPPEVVVQSPVPQAPQSPAVSPEQTQPPVQQPVPQQQVPQEPVAPQVPQLTNEERLAQYEQTLDQAYALSEDDAMALLTQPEAVLPKLAKSVHMNVMREVQTQMQQMMQAVPALLQVEAERVQVEESAKSEFYGEWPGLREHHSTVVGNANMVRKANPQATRAQIIEMAGMLTAIGLGIDPATARRQQQQVRQPLSQQRVPPVRPVGPGGSPAGLQQPPQNVFSTFADEDLNF